MRMPVPLGSGPRKALAVETNGDFSIDVTLPDGRQQLAMPRPRPAFATPPPSPQPPPPRVNVTYGRRGDHRMTSDAATSIVYHVRSARAWVCERACETFLVFVFKGSWTVGCNAAGCVLEGAPAWCQSG